MEKKKLKMHVTTLIRDHLWGATYHSKSRNK